MAQKLRLFHSFGCPAFGLDNALQSGQGLPKWSARSRLGVYLGTSPNHTRSVALILNPRTGHVSPQFHVKFDDCFETIKAKSTSSDQHDPEWKYLSGFAVSKWKKKQRQAAISTDHPQGSLTDSYSPLPQVHPLDLPQTLEDVTQGQDMDQPFADSSGTTEVSPMMPQPAPHQTKSARVIKETTPYHRSFGLVAWEFFLDQSEQVKYPTTISQYELQKKMDHPLAFVATTHPDILYAHEAMKAPDRQKFIDGMEPELSQHETRGSFVPVKKEDIPPGNKLIDMVWSMRRNEKINTQEIYKWKA